MTAKLPCTCTEKDSQREEVFWLANRIALRPKEAAMALGISERTLRQILPELPHFHAGRRVLVPVEGLRRWIEDRATAETEHASTLADEIIDSFQDE